MSTNNNNNDKNNNIVIIGSGLIGILTAYYLKIHTPNLKNKNIIIIDRQSKCAQETSYANAGRFCPSSISLSGSKKLMKKKDSSTSSSSTSSPFKLFIPTFILKTKYMQEKNTNIDPFIPSNLQTFSSISITPRLLYFGLFNIGFLQKFVQSKYYMKPPLDTKSKARTILAKLAIENMNQVINNNDKYIKKHIQYNPGTLYLYGTNTQRDFYNTTKINTMLDNGYKDTHTYPKHICYQLYPWLKTFKEHSGGYTFPGCSVVNHDWTADAYLFTTLIASKLILNNQKDKDNNNVTFQYNTTVEKLIYEKTTPFTPKDVEPKKCIGVSVTTGDENIIIPCEKVIICAGINTPKFTEMKLPMHGMQGFSIDLLDCYSTEKGNGLPTVGIADQGSDQLYFQVTPYGNKRIRLVGFGNFTNNTTNDSTTLKHAEDVLLQYFQYSFPYIKYKSKRKIWNGIRPLSPDNFPIIGKDVKTSNVYINSGQGPHGWTLSAMSGYLLSYIINQEEDEGEEGGGDGNVGKRDKVNTDVELLLKYVDPSRFYLF